MRLALEPDLEIIGEAGDGTEALAQVAALRPDVVVMDVALPRLDGLAATEALRTTVPTSAVVMLTLHDDAATRARAAAAGAIAFVAKHEPAEALPAAIRRAAERRGPDGPERGLYS
jgi:DNA-binding NarL/FixJ family response regulator